ncbi:ATP-grasp domain-containing protein [Candidatus Pelagibacter sp. Uisw_090]|uniref:ATP-grasp domain-containing protein n=1 Tax=Candidatus Pelagibacter sp. Uisw_090 TaxID=3230993 RepID=UPI0039EA19F3
MNKKNITKNKYIWILGGGRMQYFNILAAKELGYKILITDINKNCFCKSNADLFFQVDIFNIKKNLDLLNKIKKKIDIKSIFVAGIDCTITAATLAEKLNLVTSGVKIAKITNNKYLFRKFLFKNNLIDFPFLKIKNINKNINKNIEKNIGYPFIIKNTDNSASRGMQIIKSKVESKNLKKIIAKAIKVSRCGYCTVEKYFTGSEHTVETLFDINGKFYPCFITDRYFDHSSGKALEIGLRNPTQLSEIMQKKIFNYCKKVASKLGVKVGPAKFDLLIDRGKLIILEMTTRLSGGFDCQILVPAATGKKVIEAAMQISLGHKFNKKLLDKKFNRTALSTTVWPRPGKILKIKYKKPKISKNDILEVIFTKKSGDSIQDYENCADRPCFIIGASTNEKKTIDLINKAKKCIHIITK